MHTVTLLTSCCTLIHSLPQNATALVNGAHLLQRTTRSSWADFGKNRALFHKRVKFGTVVENGTRNDFGYGPAHQTLFSGCDSYC